LHFIGNLNHFLGAGFCDNGYVRKRHEEFNLKNIPREFLLNEIKKLKDVVV